MIQLKIDLCTFIKRKISPSLSLYLCTSPTLSSYDKFVQLLLALTMKFWRIFANKFPVVDKIHNSAEFREILNYLCAEQQENKKNNKASDDNLKQNLL
jgi:hypothetical protein